MTKGRENDYDLRRRGQEDETFTASKPCDIPKMIFLSLTPRVKSLHHHWLNLLSRRRKSL